MIENRRGLTFVEYLYDSGPLRFTVPFPFISASHVRAFVDSGNVGDVPSQVAITWVDAVTAEIPEQTALVAPYKVTLRRFTPIDAPLIDFRDGANLPARDLNKALRQCLYAHQELQEFAIEGGGSSIPGGNPGSGYEGDLDALVASLLNHPIMQQLVSKIALTDLNGETLLSHLLRDVEFADENRALIKRIDQTYVDAEQAWAEADTLILAEANGSLAAYQQIIEARADAHEARTTVLESTVAAQGDNIAGFQSEITAEVNALEVRTTSVETAVAANGNNYAAIEQRFEAFVQGDEDPTDPPMWSASWSIKINGGTLNGQPVVAGVGLGVDPVNGSAFVVMADKFAVVKPTYGPTDNAVVPFIVGTVGGVSTVGINGQLVVDGSITAGKITANSLSAITANAGTLNGGTFKTHTLNASGGVVDPLEFRVEISNVGDWPMWIGSGVKNANNAVMWIDRTGAAKFAGKVDAPNIMGNFQRSLAINWSGSIAVDATAGNTEVYRFTLPAPVLVGEYHTPILSLTVNNTFAIQPIYTLQYLNGSVWENIGIFTAGYGISNSVASIGITVNPGGADNHSHSAQAPNPIVQTFTSVYSYSGTISSAIPATNADATFRVLFSHNMGGTGTANVTSVRGFVMGLR